jgi:aminoglycoside 6'-N-acetyltransferase
LIVTCRTIEMTQNVSRTPSLGLACSLATIPSYRSEPEVTRWWGSIDIEEEIREEFIEADDAFVIETDGEVVGAIQYHEENDPTYRHAGMDISRRSCE